MADQGSLRCPKCQRPCSVLASTTRGGQLVCLDCVPPHVRGFYAQMPQQSTEEPTSEEPPEVTDPFTIALNIDQSKLNTMIDQRIRETLDAGKADATPNTCGEVGLLQTDSDSYLVLICNEPAGHNENRHRDAHIDGWFTALKPLTKLVRAARIVAESKDAITGVDIIRDLRDAVDGIDPGRKVL